MHFTKIAGGLGSGRMRHFHLLPMLSDEIHLAKRLLLIIKLGCKSEEKHFWPSVHSHNHPSISMGLPNYDIRYYPSADADRN